MARKRKRNPDYIAFGSDEHAAILGLKTADKDDDPQLDGWALVDITAWGPEALADDKAYLREILRQKVSNLTSEPPEFQSDDPLAPHYAPPLQVPPQGEPASGIVT
ncbi:MAG: hypothetical protein GWN93_14580 [Deltaproteobacteria bacterium]|nr:hypothetical protein [Deltaproteobacteria bacterium]